MYLDNNQLQTLFLEDAQTPTQTGQILDTGCLEIGEVVCVIDMVIRI
jgi:hypothetical protein